MHCVTLHGMCAPHSSPAAFRCTALRCKRHTILWFGRCQRWSLEALPHAPHTLTTDTYRKYEIIFSCHVTFSVVVFSNFVTSCQAELRAGAAAQTMVSPLFMSTLLSTAVAAMTLTTLCIFFSHRRAAIVPFGKPQYVWNVCAFEPGCTERMRRMEPSLFCIPETPAREYLFSASAIRLANAKTMPHRVLHALCTSF